MKIFFLTLLTACILNAELVKNGDIVTDAVTGLQWQDNDNVSHVKWEEAIQHCEKLVLGNHYDWRLANINELLSIVNYKRYEPAIDKSFENTSNFYWSSTSNSGSKNNAWGVRFGNGSADFYKKDVDNYVRCVRN